jgi:hypothetical protein
MNRRTLLFAFGALALAALGASAVEKPNFTGMWSMNAEKSDFGQMPKPQKYTRKIDHQEPLIKVAASQTTPNGERNFDITLKTDGTETINKMGPAEAKSTAHWEGETLVVVTKRETPNGTFDSTDRWLLSDGGKTLTIISSITTPNGEFGYKVVMEKQ